MALRQVFYVIPKYLSMRTQIVHTLSLKSKRTGMVSNSFKAFRTFVGEIYVKCVDLAQICAGVLDGSTDTCQGGNLITRSR